MDIRDLLDHPFTCDPVRRELYQHDVYFREMASLLEHEPADRVERMLCHSTFVMFKPDAVVGRRIEPALELLTAQGFRPLASTTVNVDPRAHRELWRYQLNAAPLAIIRTVDLILESGPCLLVALRDERDPQHSGVTAPGRLAELKGSSRNRSADGTSLRAALGCELLCLNVLHAPDDPSDLLRELGVLVPRRERAGLLARLATEPEAYHAEELATAVKNLYAEHPAHPLDRGAPDVADQPVLTEAQIMSRLDEMADAMMTLGPEHRWDRIVEAARLVDGLTSDRAPLIGSPPGARPGHRPTAPTVE